MSIKRSHPLVSVVVITYNSSDYIIDTLNSVYAQIYKNIELIVSDDASTDSTLELCKKWIVEKGDRFINIKLLSAINNNGVSANCNRGVNASAGEWIKILAGDDLLRENCISVYVANAIKKKEILFSNQVLFNGEKIIKIVNTKNLLTNDAKKQLLDYCISRPTIAPMLFFSKELYLKHGGFDEKYRLLEDVPFIFRNLKIGNYFKGIDDNLVLYRVNSSSITNDNGLTMVKKEFIDNIESFYSINILPILKKRFIFNMMRHDLKLRYEKNGKYPSRNLKSLYYKIIIIISDIEKSIFI